MKNLKIKHAQNKNFTDKIEIIMYQEETLVFYKFWIARKILELVLHYFIQENFVSFCELAALSLIAYDFSSPLSSSFQQMWERVDFEPHVKNIQISRIKNSLSVNKDFLF